jgi:hypothetical protein
MLHLRHVVLAAIAAMVWAAPVAGGYVSRQPGGATVRPSPGHFTVDRRQSGLASGRRRATSQLRRGFDRRYAMCRHRTSAEAALQLMRFTSHYNERLLQMNGIPGKIRKCARFELRFDTHVTAYQPAIRSQHTLKAVAELKWIGISATNFHFTARGPLEYHVYKYSFSVPEQGCLGEEVGKKDGRFRVSPSLIYTGPLKDGLGDVTQLIYDPGDPVLYYTSTCQGHTINDEEHAWRTVWAQDHVDELFNSTVQIDGPWALRMEYEPQQNPPKTLATRGWIFHNVTEDSGEDETTTLSIVRVG